jgi:anti-sigma-K factor RskA
MNYARQELGERLAADYALGLMPLRARRRFERAMADSATVAALAAGWSERLGPLDSLTPDEMPPARVWRAIEARVGPAAFAPKRARLSAFGIFWRGCAATAVAACAAVAIYVAVDPAPLSQTVAALAEKTGLAGWADGAKQMPDIGLSTIALGVPERERPRWLRAALLVTNDVLPATKPAPPH